MNEVSDGPGPGAPIRWARASVVLCGVLFVSGSLAAAHFAVESLHLHDDTSAYLIYYFLFYHHEPEAWAQVVLGIALAALLVRFLGPQQRLLHTLARAKSWSAMLWIGAGLVFAVCLLLTLTAQREHPLSSDEYAAVFQSEIFAKLRLSANLPDIWQPYANALTPTFIAHKGTSSVWHSSYLPVYGALRAVFVAANAPLATNPLLGALCVPLIAAVARQLWPKDRTAPVVSALLLATSCQFLITSSSFYAMPAYLTAHLAWLWLYLRNTRASLALVPVVGALALGVHQIVPHALFVAPFLLRVVLRRRYGLAAYFGAAYGVAVIAWLSWYRFAHQLPTTTASAHPVASAARHFFALSPPAYEWLNQGINLSLLFSWQSLLFTICFLLALAAWRRFHEPVWDLALGVVLTCLLFVFYLGNQGHGWGYRYFYPVLGNVTLIAVVGWQRLREIVGDGRAVAIGLFSAAFAWLVQLPLRGLQVDSVVAPFAAAHAYFLAQPERMLVIRTDIVWYGADMVRNPPFLDGPSPLVLRMTDLPASAAQTLPLLGSVRVVSPEEFERLGLPLTPAGRAAKH